VSWFFFDREYPPLRYIHHTVRHLKIVFTDRHRSDGIMRKMVVVHMLEIDVGQ
jgi:hypothetical protein